MYGRWQDYLFVVYGVWLILSPHLTGYGAQESGAVWNAYATGAILLIMARSALITHDLWEEGINIIVGTWLYFSPFIVDFYGNNAATWTQMSMGVLIFWTAVWALGQETDTRISQDADDDPTHIEYRRQF